MSDIMNASILNTIKSMLNIDPEITEFDSDLIVLINTSLSTLYQLGVGDKQFSITGSTEKWSDLLTDESYLEMIKSFIFIDVKIVFDPPTSSIVMEAYKETRKEYIWRINSQIEVARSSGGSGGSGTNDYNDLINKPKLDGVELKGDVRMNIASKEYVDETVGEIENGYY